MQADAELIRKLEFPLFTLAGDVLRACLESHLNAFGVPTLVGICLYLKRQPTKVGTPNGLSQRVLRLRRGVMGNRSFTRQTAMPVLPCLPGMLETALRVGPPEAALRG